MSQRFSCWVQCIFNNEFINRYQRSVIFSIVKRQLHCASNWTNSTAHCIGMIIYWLNTLTSLDSWVWSIWMFSDNFCSSCSGIWKHLYFSSSGMLVTDIYHCLYIYVCYVNVKKNIFFHAQCFWYSFHWYLYHWIREWLFHMNEYFVVNWAILSSAGALVCLGGTFPARVLHLPNKQEGTAVGTLGHLKKHGLDHLTNASDNDAKRLDKYSW